MKHIALLRDDRPFWDDIVKHLHNVHVKMSAFGATWTPEEIVGLSPDLIVTNLSNLTHLKISLRRIPIVAIQADSEGTHLLPVSKLEWNLEVVTWPADKDEFLQVTSRQLAVTPRKIFACIFRIYSGHDDAVAMAQLVNLSMTGLAFKTIAEFEIGRNLRIALDLPGERDALQAQARIVRIDDEEDDDPRILYGAEYHIPSEEFRKALKRFIHAY